MTDIIEQKTAQKTIIFENTLNELVNINKLKKIELKLFYALVMGVHNKGTDTIVFDISELKETTRYKVATREEWTEIIDKAIDKVFPLFWSRRIENKIEKMMLFRQLSYEIDNDIVIVRINEDSKFIFNDIKKTFTKFGWASFVRLNSKYAQLLFPQLQQYNSIGKRTYTKEDLFKLLDVPKSMRVSNNFNKRILNPIKEELSEIFIDFEVIAHRGRGKGRPVIAYEFRWNNDNHKARIEQKQQKEAANARKEFQDSFKNGAEPNPDDYYNWIDGIKDGFGK